MVVSLEQRAAASRRARISPEDHKKVKRGVIHYGLVLHLRNTVLFERVLAYEAMMNKTTLEEWLVRNRVGGKPSGEELYLKPDLFIYHLDGNFFNCKPRNLYCFESKSKFLSWRAKNRYQVVRLTGNFDGIKSICAAWTANRWAQLEREGVEHPQLWGVWSCTHVVMLDVGFNSSFQSDKSFSLLCNLTGQKVLCAGVKHTEVELLNGQKFFVVESRVRQRAAGDH